MVGKVTLDIVPESELEARALSMESASINEVNGNDDVVVMYFHPIHLHFEYVA